MVMFMVVVMVGGVVMVVPGEVMPVVLMVMVVMVFTGFVLLRMAMAVTLCVRFVVLLMVVAAAMVVVGLLVVVVATIVLLAGSGLKLHHTQVLNFLRICQGGDQLNVLERQKRGRGEERQRGGL